ncbi:hypothetical protein ML8HA_01978 [Lactococcus lactis]|nr:hypothetical protein [Lactococcus lactis]
MKFGMRKPSITKSLKARTTAKYKRKVKKSLIPGYGKKGMVGAKIQKNLLIIKFIRKQLSQFGICLNKNRVANLVKRQE